MGFTGFSSRIDPVQLAERVLQQSSNLRLEGRTARLRLGAQRLNDAASLNGYTTWGDCVFTDPSGLEKLVLVATSSGVTSLFVYTPAQGSTAASMQGPFAFPTGRTVTSRCDVVQAGGAVYVSRGRATESAKAVASATLGGGLVTVTTSAAHGFATGDEVLVEGTANGGSFVVTVTGATTFTYSAGAAPTGTITATRCKPLIKWDGLTYSSAGLSVVAQSAPSGSNANPPPADFGLYHQGRLVLAYKTDRLAVSDIFDYETYDLTLNNFRINPGSNDQLVGFLPWVDDSFLALMKRGVYMVGLDTSSFVPGTPPGANSYIRLLSNEIGCVARRSAVTAGQRVFFLSQLGVHLMTPQLDLTLTGETLPLSDPIDDIIRSLNADAVAGAVGCYFNNRYWLAVPAGSNTRNNALLVYNTLNQQWETVDTFPPGFYCDDLQVSTYGAKKRLYIISREGGIYVHEENASGDNVYSAVAQPVLPATLPWTLVPASLSTVPVTGVARTRTYQLGSLASKRWSKAEVACYGTGSLALAATLHDPDDTENLGTAALPGGDAIQRVRVASKARAIDLSLTLTGASPEVRGCVVHGLANSFQTISRQ